MTRRDGPGPAATPPASAEAAAYRKTVQSLVNGCIARIRAYELPDDALPLTQWRPGDD